MRGLFGATNITRPECPVLPMMCLMFLPEGHSTGSDNRIPAAKMKFSTHMANTDDNSSSGRLMRPVSNIAIQANTSGRCSLFDRDGLAVSPRLAQCASTSGSPSIFVGIVA